MTTRAVTRTGGSDPYAHGKSESIAGAVVALALLAIVDCHV